MQFGFLMSYFCLNLYLLDYFSCIIYVKTELKEINLLPHDFDCAFCISCLFFFLFFLFVHTSWYFQTLMINTKSLNNIKLFYIVVCSLFIVNLISNHTTRKYEKVICKRCQ